MPNVPKIRTNQLASPPPELPVYGRVDPAEVSFISRTNYVAALDEKKFIFGIKRVDRSRHVYIVGKVGVGKSKLLELLIRQDIANGHGLCLIDPHGDVIESVLDFIPLARVEDVVCIDPSDLRQPPLFNPLADVDLNLRHQLTQGLIEVMKKQFDVHWTPRLEHLFRFTCLALLDYPRATLQEMILMLTDSNYREKVLEHIKDDVVKRFWAVEFAEWLEKYSSDAVTPLVNKLSQFFSNPMLRNIFCQQENKINFGELIAQKKIILINLAIDKLGEENASFLGLIFIAKLQQAGMMRATLPESQRHDFYLYVDDFHSLVTQTFGDLMSKARKYGFCLAVAHQYMGQLSKRIQALILGNVGTIIVFRVGGEDAEALEAEMAPIFRARDMINLGPREFYIKMLIDGEVYDPFSAETLKVLPPPHSSYKQEVIEASRRKYTRPV